MASAISLRERLRTFRKYGFATERTKEDCNDRPNQGLVSHSRLKPVRLHQKNCCALLTSAKTRKWTARHLPSLRSHYWPAADLRMPFVITLERLARLLPLTPSGSRHDDAVIAYRLHEPLLCRFRTPHRRVLGSSLNIQIAAAFIEPGKNHIRQPGETPELVAEAAFHWLPARRPVLLTVEAACRPPMQVHGHSSAFPPPSQRS